MSFIDVIVGQLAPYDCLGCEQEGKILCDLCLDRLSSISDRCYNCRGLSQNSLTCLNCRSSSYLYQVTVATVYSGLAKDLIWQLKLAGNRNAAEIMATKMAPLIEHRGEALIVPVPTATSRSRQRGYDQAKLLATQISRKTEIPYLDCLKRHGQMHQHGLSRQHRLNQLKTAFRLTQPQIVKNQRIILIDDVITTGATLEAAAKVLHQAGVSSITALVFAQPEQDIL